MSGASAVLQVVILRDGLLVGTEVVVPGSYQLGSAPDADLRLDDVSVEPAHAVLYFQNGRVAIQDTQSRTGLYVNGHRVQACEVRAIDEVMVGPFVLKVRVLSQRPKVKAPHPEVANLLAHTPTRPAAPDVPSIPPVATLPGVRTTRPGPPAEMVKTAPAFSQSSTHPPTSPRSGPPQAPPALAASARSTELGGTALSSRRMGQLAGAAAPAASPETASARPVPHLRALTPLPFDLDEPTQTPQSRTTEHLELDESSGDSDADAYAATSVHSPPQAPVLELQGKGVSKRRPRLYLELYWGGSRQELRSFARGDGEVLAGTEGKQAFPLWGFALPSESEDFTLAAPAKRGTFRLYLPPGAQVEQRDARGHYLPVPGSSLQADEDRRFLTLENGGALRLREGQMTLLAYVAPRPKRPFGNPLRGTPWLLLFWILALGAGFGTFLHFTPDRFEPEFTTKNIAPVAVRLLAPEPKKKEEAKKKLEAIKEKAEAKKSATEKKVEKAVAKVEKTVPKALAKAPQTEALKALAKLTAGPASRNLLAQVDKMAPGAKANKDEVKLAGLFGNTPVANVGLGMSGLGGKGGATQGAELLRGRGAAGIGALGVGGVGKGAVGGTVSRATSGSIGMGRSTGTIDRDAVAKTVNAHLQEVRACYERALLKDPGLAGKVVLEWNISTNGDVVSAKTKSSSLHNAAVERCILSNLKSWKFPKAKGGVVIVSYPFLFNSVGY